MADMSTELKGCTEVLVSVAEDRELWPRVNKVS